MVMRLSPTILTPPKLPNPNSVFMLSFLNVQDENLEFRLTKERRLEQVMLIAGIDDPTSVTRLTILGTITKEDFKFIRRKMGKSLKELDISKATLEESKLKKGALANCFALTSVSIPNWLFEITEGAFSKCFSLQHIDIPKSVTIIGDLAFWRCSGLTSIQIPNSVVEIGFRAFNCCTGLTSVELPDSVVKIGGNAFGRCTRLVNINIPESVTEIGNGAFAGCTNLASIYIPPTTLKVGGWAFDNCNAFITVHPDNPVYTSIDGKLYSRYFLSLPKK